MKNKSLSELKLLAEQNNPEALYELGNSFYFGTKGLEKDYKKALQYFIKAKENRKH